MRRIVQTSASPVGDLHGLNGIPSPCIVRSPSAAQATIEHLTEPDAKRPSVSDLMARFDVARMISREALRVLRAEDVVRS